jgi:hypothetical protein
MTVRHTILTLAVAGLACAAPAAQAHLLVNDSAVTSKSSASAKSSLSVMTAAGIRYHAAANYKNEQRLLGQSSSSVRPDDRAGVRGI